MKRGDLTNQQWADLQPLLPPQKPKTGRPADDHRHMINGMLWILRTGAPWRDLPERYGPWRTVASRFYRWCRLGIWQHVLQALHGQADAAGKIDWDTHQVDGTIVRAHQHAAGANATTPEAEAVGSSRGGVSTKVPVRSDGRGQLLHMGLTPGQRHETTAFEALMNGDAVKRPGRSQARLRPRRVVGDKAYGSRRIRRWLRQRGLGAVIPRKRNERRRGPFDRARYRERNRVERLINRCKQFRRIATRYEKRAKHYLAMWQIAAILLRL
jgi:transposase